MSWSKAKAALHAEANPKLAELHKRFFKTGPGEYGYGDVFLGLKVPTTRKIAKNFKDLSLKELRTGLKSRYHEERLLALILLVEMFENGTPAEKQAVFSFYLQNAARVNNWDLVDTSAAQIVGAYLVDRDRDLLYQLIKSTSLWERRIAMVATHALIRRGELKDCFALAKLCFDDDQDLMHKAAGWMLREAGKKDRAALKDFIDSNHPKMPRVMLRYAIEHFSATARKPYLSSPRKKNSK